MLRKNNEFCDNLKGQSVRGTVSEVPFKGGLGREEQVQKEVVLTTQTW